MDLLLAILRWICGLWNGEPVVMQPVPVRVVGACRIVPGRRPVSARLRAWGRLTHSISIRDEDSWGGQVSRGGQVRGGCLGLRVTPWEQRSPDDTPNR
jgi:hypothetical protein